MAQLILKLKGSDFDKGLSLQSRYAIGGLFQTASNYDPFLKLGRLYPTMAPTQKDGGNIAVPIRAFDFRASATTRYLYAFGNRNSSGKGAYAINLENDTIADLASYTHTNLGGATTQNCSMVKFWQNRIIYSQDDSGASIRSIATDYSDDRAILTGLANGTPNHPAVVGPDGFLYVLNGQYIAVLYAANATSNGSGTNSATKLDTLQSDLIGRDLDHDGQYIFAGFDNNAGKLSGVKADCQIVIWDRFKSYAEKRYPLSEAYIIAVRCLGQSCYVLTPSGWYVCSIVTEPKLVYPMTSETSFNYFPTDYNGVSKNGHSIYWADGSGGDRVHAIGQKITGKPRIVYNPYSGSNSPVTTESITSLIVANSYIYTGTSVNRVYKLNSDASAFCTIESCPQYLPQPFTFSYTKVKLARKMGVGDSVNHRLYNSDAELISDSETIAYNSANPLKSLIFRKYANGSPLINDFTDCYPTILTNCEIAEIEVYGDPLPIHSQQT